MGLAGLPATTSPAATSRVTTAPASIRARSPIVTPFSTIAPMPIHTSAPTEIGFDLCVGRSQGSARESHRSATGENGNEKREKEGEKGIYLGIARALSIEPASEARCAKSQQRIEKRVTRHEMRAERNSLRSNRNAGRAEFSPRVHFNGC